MILTYLIFTLIVGLYFSKSSTQNNYLYSSRKLTLPSFIATLVTTWYGGILAVGDYVYINGIITWIVFCLFYYLAAIIYATFFAPNIIKYKINTLPSYFKDKLSKESAVFAGIILILLSSPAPYIMIFCTIINHIYNINIILSILISITFTTVYCYYGGLNSIFKTDKIQFILMYGGFIGIILTLMNTYGGYDYILNNTPEKYLNISTNDMINVLPWSIIAITMFIDPNIIQRTYLGKDVKTVRKGILISIIFWFIFDLLSITTGLYAISIISNTSSTSTYLALADITLSPIMRDVFFISLLAIVMSTIDSYTFTSSFIISKDIIPLISKNYNKNLIVKHTRYSIIITSVVAAVLIIIIGYEKFNYAIEFWYQIGSLAATTILVPYIFLINKKSITHPIYVLSIPLITFIITSYFYPGINAIYLGLGASIILCILFSRNSIK